MEEDEKIRSQRVCCISFIDQPSNYWKLMEEKTHLFLNNILSKQNNVIENELTRREFKEKCEDFYIDNQKSIRSHLPEKLKNKPHVKSLKIRGAYKTLEEAQDKIKTLYEKMKKSEPVTIYISQVGKWTPFMFDEGSNGSEKLNYTLYSYYENIKKTKFDFDSRMKNVEIEKTFLKGNIENPVYEKYEYNYDNYDPSRDYIDEDEEISYRYFCVSFHDVHKEVEKFIIDKTMIEFVYNFLVLQTKMYNTEHHTDTSMALTREQIKELFKNFHFEYTPQEEKCIPCFKLRNVCRSKTEAENFCKKMQQIDDKVDILVGNVGVWLPFSPARDDLDIKYSDEKIQKIYDARRENAKKTTNAISHFEKLGYNTKQTNFGNKISKRTEDYF